MLVEWTPANWVPEVSGIFDPAQRLTSSVRLTAGEFLGQTEQRRQTAGLELVRSTHALAPRSPHMNTLSGKYVERYGRRKRLCGEHLVVYHPAGEGHSQVHESQVQTLNVQIDAAWFRRVFDAVAALDQPRELRDDSVVSAAVRLGQIAFSPEPDTAFALECLVWEILAAAASGAATAVKTRLPWLNIAFDLLRQDLHESMEFGQLADHVGVHPVYFAASFRRHFGVSAGEYRRKLRVELVQRRLHDPAFSLAEIAAEAGFAGQSHMTRAFKRYAGVAPAAYRSLLAFKTRGHRHG